MHPPRVKVVIGRSSLGQVYVVSCSCTSGTYTRSPPAWPSHPQHLSCGTAPSAHPSLPSPPHFFQSSIPRRKRSMPQNNRPSFQPLPHSTPLSKKALHVLAFHSLFPSSFAPQPRLLTSLRLAAAGPSPSPSHHLLSHAYPPSLPLSSHYACVGTVPLCLDSKPRASATSDDPLGLALPCPPGPGERISFPPPKYTRRRAGRQAYKIAQYYKNTCTWSKSDVCCEIVARGMRRLQEQRVARTIALKEDIQVPFQPASLTRVRPPWLW